MMDREIISFNAELTPPLYGLPDMVQNLIRDVAEKRLAPIEFTLAPALAAISIAVGNKATVSFNSYENRLNLWELIVAPSGKNKSQPTKDLFVPIQKIDSELVSKYDMTEKEAEKAKREGNEVPYVKRYSLIDQDSTAEARLLLLHDNPHGILMYRDELSAFIADLGRYNKSGELSDLLTIFDNGSIKVNRKGQGLMKVEKPYLSMIGGIQPDYIQQTLGDIKFTATGFLNRFLIFYPTEYPEKVFQDNVMLDYRLLEQWSKLVKRIYDFDREMILHVTNEATNVYKRFFNATAAAEDRAKTDYERSIWAKLHIHVIKLAALASVMHTFAEGLENCGRMISATDMSWAVDMAYYFHATQMRVYDKITGGDAAEVPPRAKVLQWFMHYFPDINRSKLAELSGMNRKSFIRAASKNSK